MPVSNPLWAAVTDPEVGTNSVKSVVEGNGTGPVTRWQRVRNCRGGVSFGPGSSIQPAGNWRRTVLDPEGLYRHIPAAR